VLGPVDPQLGQYPAASVLKVAREKPIEHLDDKTLILADQAEKAIRQVHDAVYEFLKERFAADKAEELANRLSSGTWTHDYPITPAEAAEMGLPVTTEMPEDFLLLMNFFPQPVRRLASVQYLPERRSGGKSKGRR